MDTITSMMSNCVDGASGNPCLSIGRNLVLENVPPLQRNPLPIIAKDLAVRQYQHRVGLKNSEGVQVVAAITGDIGLNHLKAGNLFGILISEGLSGERDSLLYLARLSPPDELKSPFRY